MVESRRNRSRRRLGLAALIGGVMAVAAAQSAGAETLTDALVKAYTTNPQLLSERAQLRQLDEGVPQALSGWRPTVQVDSSYSQSWTYTTYNNDAVDDSNSHATPYGFTGSINQPVFQGFRTVAQTDQAEALIRAGRAQLIQIEQDVLLDTVSAFMQVVRDQAVLELRINNERVLRRQLQATRDRFEVGELTRTDVAQAESRLSRAVAQRIEAEGSLASSRAEYVAVVGEMPTGLEQPQPLSDLPTSREETINLALAHAPGVRAAIANLQAARHGVDINMSALLPSVSVQLSQAYNFDQASGTAGLNADSNALTFRAQMTVPLYQGGAEYSQVREAKQAVAQYVQDLDETRRTSVQAATQAWEALLTAQASIASIEDEIAAASIALEGVREESLVGSRTVLDVLNAEQELLNAQVSLVRAETEEVVAAYTLASSIGRLTARDLGLPVEYYDPEAYYDEVRDSWIGLGD